jgi:hypothetical protein
MKFELPVISHEMKFVSLNIYDIDSVLDGSIKVNAAVKKVTESMYDRVETEVLELLDSLKTTLSASVRQSFRIDQWHKSRQNWDVWSDVHLGVRGRRKRSPAFVGFCIGQGPEIGFRLIAYSKLRRGGQDAQSKFGNAMRNRLDGVFLTSDRSARYSQWKDYTIWFDHILKPNTSHRGLDATFRKRAKAFFKAARPLLIKAVDM